MSEIGIIGKLVIIIDKIKSKKFDKSLGNALFIGLQDKTWNVGKCKKSNVISQNLYKNFTTLTLKRIAKNRMVKRIENVKDFIRSSVAYSLNFSSILFLIIYLWYRTLKLQLITYFYKWGPIFSWLEFRSQNPQGLRFLLKLLQISELLKLKYKILPKISDFLLFR